MIMKDYFKRTYKIKTSELNNNEEIKARKWKMERKHT